MTGIINLRNLPVMPSLETLDMSDNSLTGEDLYYVPPNFTNLRVLKLSNNDIRKMEYLSHLNKCSHLQSLDLSANPITEVFKYRENIFEKLTSLEALDGFDRDGSEWSLLDPGEVVYDEGDKMQNNEVIL